MAKIKADHHKGTHQARARKLVAAANANPSTVCGRCGEPARPGDPWQAGHVNDGQVNGPLRPEHRSCNASAGATMGNQRRQGLTTTRRW